VKLTVHGREAYAYTGGKIFDPALPCVVFIHGAMNDHCVWTLLARWFAHHGHGVLAVDLPGHMRSAGPALRSVPEMADWLLAVLDAAGVQRAALVGHSMGSLIALSAAARAPERIHHLAMIGTCVPMPVPQPLLELSLAQPLAAIDRVVMFSFSSLAAKPSFPGPGVWIRNAARALMRQVLAAQGDATLFHTDFSACNGYVDGLQDAARVRCPATLLLGQYDQMTLPRGARDVAQALKARVHTLPAGHQMMAESPDLVMTLLRTDFTMGHTATAAAAG
jgi:pimeloyl-ACP methyl ester carboxylesterase